MRDLRRGACRHRGTDVRTKFSRTFRRDEVNWRVDKRDPPGRRQEERGSQGTPVKGTGIKNGVPALRVSVYEQKRTVSPRIRAIGMPKIRFPSVIPLGPFPRDFFNKISSLYIYIYICIRI